MQKNIDRCLIRIDQNQKTMTQRSLEVAKLCKYMGQYLQSVDTIVDNVGEMLDVDTLCAKNDIFKPSYFKKRFVAKPNQGKKKPKSTTNKLAHSLVSHKDDGFLFENCIDFNKAHLTIHNTESDDFFKDFGLSLKLCPSGFIQRKVEDRIFQTNTDVDTFIDENLYWNTWLYKDHELINVRDVIDAKNRNEPLGVENYEKIKNIVIEFRNLLSQKYQAQISQPIWMLDAEITTELFKRIMNLDTSNILNMENKKNKKMYPFLPIENVDFDMAIIFCNKLSIELGLKPCYLDKDDQPILSILDYKKQAENDKNHPFNTWRSLWSYYINDHVPKEIYNITETQPKDTVVKWDKSANGFRLPTENEWYWVYAANTKQKYLYDQDAKKDTIDDVERTAWVKQNTNTLKPIKQKEPNAWGMYDMCGNVSELCFSFGYEYVSPDKNPFPDKFDKFYPIRYITRLDPLQSVAGKLVKDYYWGLPTQASVLADEKITYISEKKENENPILTQQALTTDEIKKFFQKRMTKRWLTTVLGYHYEFAFNKYASSAPFYFNQGAGQGAIYLDGSGTETHIVIQPNSVHNFWGNHIGFRICKNVDA